MYVINKLKFYFFIIKFCFGLSVFLNYPLTTLPTITLDNQEFLR